MKSKRLYIRFCLAALLLCMVTIAVSVLPAAAETAEPSFSSMDYGIPDRADNITWSTEQLYKTIFGKAPTAAEAAYLSAHGFSFTYHSEFPKGLINTHYESEIGRLSVTINSYSYVASNGETVVWHPTHLTVDGKSEEMTAQGDGTYTCVLEELFYTDDFQMTVDYAWDVTIPKALLEEACTKPYAIGLSAFERQRAYEEAYAAYTEQLQAYEAWQAYADWKALDDSYQAELIAYRAAVDAYNTYLTAMRTYNEQMAVVEQWNRYYDAVAVYNAQMSAYKNYEGYTTKLTPILKRLDLLESVYIRDSHGWVLYSSIVGDTVDRVLADKDLLVDQLLVPQATVDKANASTHVLRGLLSQYATLRSATYSSEHEKIATLYAFYTEHYEELGANFKDLYDALSRLYKEATVRLAMDAENQRAHYEQFVSQLYVMYTCLDESVTRPSDGEADPRLADWLDKRLVDVVEEAQRIPDGVWTPVGLPMPNEVAVATKPIQPAAPTTPYPDPTPIKPTAVAKPGQEPAKPQNPYEDGNIPSETAHPGEAPAAPVLTDIERALADEVESKKLTPYTGTVSDFDLHFENRIQYSVSIRNLKTVSFYDYQGNLITTKTVNFGGRVDCALPNREADAQYTYEALGWVLHDGTDATALLQNITTDLSLYPKYQGHLRSYDITWELDGEQIVTTYPYGATPQVPRQWLLESYEKNHYVYSFSGWFAPDGEPAVIQAVTGPATYCGNMIRTLKNYTVTWILYDGMEITETLPALTTPTPPDTDRPADAYRYVFEGWDRAVGTLTRDVTYKALYRAVKLVSGGFGSGTVLTPEHSEDRVTVSAGSEVLVDIEGLLDYAAEEEKEIAINWESGASLQVDQGVLGTLREADVHRVILRRNDEGTDGITYSLIFQDASGSMVSELPRRVKLVLPVTDATAGTAFFLKTQEGMVRLEGNEVEVGASATILQCNVYTISITPNEYLGDTRPIPTSSVAGEIISLAPMCIYGYEIVDASVIDADGNSISVSEDMTFVMPASAVKVTFDVRQIVYTVIFRVDGEIISQKEYALGDVIELPADPVKELDDGYVYVFSTWGDVLPTAGGDARELVYDAVFKQTQKTEAPPEDPTVNLFLKIYIPVGIGILLLIIGLIIFLVRRRRRYY